jgi:hypothetical protein
MDFIEKNGEYVTPDELVSVYQCTDGSWRVAWYPYYDKERNLTKAQAFAIAEEKHKEASACFCANKS